MCCAAVDISLQESQYVVGEADELVEVCAVLVGGVVERMVEVILSTSDIDATGESASTVLETNFELFTKSFLRAACFAYHYD